VAHPLAFDAGEHEHGEKLDQLGRRMDVRRRAAAAGEPDDFTGFGF
jgi:hypothetical protein